MVYFLLSLRMRIASCNQPLLTLPLPSEGIFPVRAFTLFPPNVSLLISQPCRGLHLLEITESAPTGTPSVAGTNSLGVAQAAASASSSGGGSSRSSSGVRSVRAGVWMDGGMRAYFECENLRTTMDLVPTPWCKWSCDLRRR